jgi:LysM repeat protein/uncharacterized protein YraI
MAKLIRRILPFGFTALLLVLAGTTVVAQTVSVDCPTVVNLALEALGNNCGELGLNLACYGYDDVDTTFVTAVEPGFFSQPSDQTELTMLSSIQTSPLNEEDGRWGIAMMHVQANVPNTAPGQSVIFLLMGDAQVTNAVDPETALLPVTPVDVTLIASTVVRTGPNTASNDVGTASAGTALRADALNRDRTWLRVLYDGRAAWVPVDRVSNNDGLSGLPAITADTRTPMQAFYFSTGFGTAGCAEAPSSVTVRSPENVTVNLNINGLDVTIGSTISLLSAADDQINMVVQEGRLVTVSGEVVETGQTLVATTDPEGNILNLQEVRPATESELQLGGVTETALLAAGIQPGEIIHIVAAGETLYSIARLYDASMPAIVQRNGIADPRSIFVGQRLVIPNPYSGFVAIDLPEEVVDVGNPNVDCTGFSLTSPLDGLVDGANTFYWNPASGATSYRVNVYNRTQPMSVSFSTDGGSTSLIGNTSVSAVGGGFDFAWEAQAMYQGQVACTTARVNVPRGSGTAGPAPSGPTFSASWACSGANTVQVTYANAPAGDTVNISFGYMLGGIPGTQTYSALPGPAGSVTYVPIDSVSGGVVTASSGPSVALTPGGLVCP